MTLRERRLWDAEDIALSALTDRRDRWVSARDVAAETGAPWRSTARALRRMVAAGKVAESILDWRDKDYRLRHRRLYQLRGEDSLDDGWPEWAMPRPKPRNP